MKTLPRNGKCVLLARSASADQQPDGCERQVEALRSYATDNGMVVVDEITLNGVSGTGSHEHVVDAVLSRHKESGFNTLLATDCTRISRSLIGVTEAMRALTKKGIGTQ